MKFCHVKNMVIGEGIPKICVPLTSNSLLDLLNEIKELKKYPVDLVEWRMDLYENIQDLHSTLDTVKQLYVALSDIPLLCTFRTIKEGGNTPFSEEAYLNVYTNIMNYCDIIDIEFFQKPEIINSLITLARNKDIKVLLSNHDFYTTPSKKEIIQRLQTMQSVGADIVKIAVMPQNKKDVLTLLDATLTAKNQIDIPIVTMSMGEIGKISRITGEFFGSNITFGSVKNSSAPGQIPIQQLVRLLNDIHK
jgi:3-dehydroquinate dehydratase-1